ncbi:hypothetical protein [Natranaerobius thermophilus]|uniref:Uncharacterized protein n=1 Tax=Natranaerobius thermophilus (strain ATCC BAA-1301 / DSM 18059 / JW/NM-WN-LF) TaxID=457570 RepID=B2A4X2_NATTJ|nr:hypothetical protein [Natranaerobius thermophilus]ACB83894.1 hypothetical protein Nther_0296 [Natranaerobius thermophilus JW/NM-WN-LF]
MNFDDVIEELKRSWQKYQIQTVLIINLVFGLTALGITYATADSLAFFELFLRLIAVFTPLILLILFMLRGYHVLFLSQFNNEQMYWWSMTDISVGAPLFTFWLITLLLWEGVSILAILLIYLKLLIYIMLILSAALTAMVLANKFWIALTAGIVLHLGLYGLSVILPDVQFLGLRFLPYHLITNFRQILELNLGMWELLTPLAVSGIILWVIRNVAVQNY